MKKGQASRTAELVCMARAVAHGRTPVQAFSDPTALTWLRPEDRAQVELVRHGGGSRFARMSHQARSQMMVARTVFIDESIREAHAPQVVILGAGLDGRAWRMPELRDAVVFEVDHPDSQRDKRERAAALTSTARELRFAACDFATDSLDDVLGRAGHDPTLPTMWVWEGVVMYLTPAQVEATLAIIAKRSARGSTLTIAYFAPALLVAVAGLVLRFIGEPLQSSFTELQMRELLAKYGFAVKRDESLLEIGQRLGADVARVTKRQKHFRLLVGRRD